MTSAAANPEPGHPQGGTPGAREWISDRLAWVANMAGHFAAVMMVLLTVGIVLDIVLRWFQVENSWAFNLSLFSMAWMAFTGAALTSLRKQHVTAGIALENLLGYGGLVGAIRMVVLCGFLLLLAISGYHQALDSFSTHKVTLDLSRWQVWVGEASVPVGAVLWIFAAIAVFLRRQTKAAADTREISAPI